jgi:hypothetical protein
MSGITFMVDERGQKTAAVIDLRKHEQLWEDFHDSLLAKSRAREPRENLESVHRRRRDIFVETQTKNFPAPSGRHIL